MPQEIKHSIKVDIKEFFLILNCTYITGTSMLSLLQNNKVITLTAFAFCFLNCIISVLFYFMRITHYQRSESLKEPE